MNNRNKLYTAITLSLSMGASMAQFAPEIELADIGVYEFDGGNFDVIFEDGFE